MVKSVALTVKFNSNSDMYIPYSVYMCIHMYMYTCMYSVHIPNFQGISCIYNIYTHVHCTCIIYIHDLLPCYVTTAQQQPACSQLTARSKGLVCDKNN